MIGHSPPELISKRCKIKLLRLSIYRTFPKAAAVLGPEYQRFENRSSLLFPGMRLVADVSWPWLVILSLRLITLRSVNPRSWSGQCLAPAAPNGLPDSSENRRQWRCA